MFEFKVYRNGDYAGNVNIDKKGAQWQPLEKREQNVLLKGDIVESVSDGTKFEVKHHVAKGYLHPMFQLELIEDES